MQVGPPAGPNLHYESWALGYTNSTHLQPARTAPSSGTPPASSAAAHSPPPQQFSPLPPHTRPRHCCLHALSTAATRPRQYNHAARPLRSNAYALSATTQSPPPLLFALFLLRCWSPQPLTLFLCLRRLRPTRSSHAATYSWSTEDCAQGEDLGALRRLGEEEAHRALSGWTRLRPSGAPARKKKK